MGPIAKEFPKWQKWAQRIKSDVESRLVHPRQVFRALVEVINQNSRHIAEHNGEAFCNFIKRCYVSHVVMAIRSHVKKGDSCSFMRLLQQLHDSGKKFTFKFYLQQFPIDKSHADWQTATFSEFSDDGKVLLPSLVQRDMDNLRKISSQIEDFGDQAIAHLDKRGFSGQVTFGDLDACIDAFDQLLCKYLKLISGDGYLTLEPAILESFTEIFTVPLDNRHGE
jgi:hypothetical protein